MKIYRLPVFALAMIFISSCATSPTGRKQLILLGDSEMSLQGTQAFTEMKHQTPSDADPKINSYVHCVVDPITKVVDAKQGKAQNWEVVVFKSDEVNAFALPGGKIGVYSGILKAAQNADQLAAVLGHEVGHVLARHGNERVSDALLAQGLVTATGVIAGNQSQKNQIMLAALGAGAQFGLLKFSRDQESEADLIGLDLMARAGFDPNQSVELWHNMTKVSGGGAPPEFMSTHPSNEKRIKALQANIPNAMPLYQQAPSHPHCTL